MPSSQLSCADYHVAWICPDADVELLPARLMLDEEHSTPPYDTHYDENTYICGTINGHTVVIATCPQGETGNVNAGRLTGFLFKTFFNIRMAVLVGIGSGIPRATVSANSLENIHLGDVVVGWPGDGKPACVYHERGRSKVEGKFEMVGTMQNPDWRLTNALGILVSDHELGRTKFDDQRKRLQKHKRFAHPGFEHDKLFKAGYHHIGEHGSDCMECNQNELIRRPPRTEEDEQRLVFHRGRIATGNAVIQDGELRDQISVKCDGALCVEMEAAGVEANKKCLVVRGISDYADSHKDGVWKSYAAGTAAAFTRELLCRIQPKIIREMEKTPEAPWLVPFARPYCFAGRETQLDQLNACILSEDYQRLAIHGLGGCGKTALALESAYRMREQQPTRAVFWVPAISLESFEQAYREIGILLRISGIEDDKLDAKQLVQAKLSDENFGPWLMIVDNADDTNVLFDRSEGESGDRLADFLPHSRKGSIVFTTRTRAAAVKLAGSSVVALGELEAKQAKEMLERRVLQKGVLEDGKVVDEFLGILTFLPLAIIQAVAFINANNSTLSEYICAYRDSNRDAIELLSKDFEDHGRYRATKNPVATTWYISFKQIQKQSPLAIDYLSFMACTIGSHIPSSLLWPGNSKLETIEAIGTLDAYAFVTERQQPQQGRETISQERIFTVHQLVRLAMHNWLTEHGQWSSWAVRALRRFVEMVPFGDYNKREVWTAYLPHAVYIVDMPELYEAEERMSLLDRIGRCEETLGRYTAAEVAHRKLIERREEVLGREHTDTLISRNQLGIALFERGKYVEAEQMLRETLALRENVSGKEHRETLSCMSNVAEIIDDQGKYGEAEEMHREVLTLREKVLGKEHPDTLSSMSHVAATLSNQGKYAEAEEMHREALALTQKVLGKEHPHTLSSMSHVAMTLNNQEKYAEAEEMHREVLALEEKVLGKEHPDTLNSMNNVAATLSYQEKYAEAEEMHRETLALEEKVLGKEHRHTLTSMSHVAATLRNQEKYAEAEEMHRETLALREKVLGEEHPNTLSSMSHVAATLINQGKYAKAEEMHREVLALREKVLGKEHPDTLNSMKNVAATLSYQGKYAEAEEVHRETLALREKVLGKEHPDTLNSRNNVAATLSGQGKYAEAEEMHRETLALSEKVLGMEHRITLAGIYWLAHLLDWQEQYQEALVHYRKAWTGYQKQLGVCHPTTQACLSAYSSLQTRCGSEPPVDSGDPENSTQENIMQAWSQQQPQLVGLGRTKTKGSKRHRLLRKLRLE